MTHDIDPRARRIHHPKPRRVRLERSSPWRCFWVALGMSLLAVVLLWLIAALIFGVPIPMAGHDARGLTDMGTALMAMFFYMLLFFPIPIAMVFISAVTVDIVIRDYPTEPAMARRAAMRRAFLTTLVIAGICLPAFLRYMHTS